MHENRNRESAGLARTLHKGGHLTNRRDRTKDLEKRVSYGYIGSRDGWLRNPTRVTHADFANVGGDE